jgi:hypothetical protein
MGSHHTLTLHGDGLRTSLLFAVLCAAGCGGGGGGSSANLGDDVNGAAAEVTVSELGGGRFEIDFVLRAPTAKQVAADIEYSEDRGASYGAATLDAGSSATSLSANPAGIRHSFTWTSTADLSIPEQHDLRVRVSPYDRKTGDRGVSSESGVFGLGGNTAPAMSSISTPPLSGGWVLLGYTVADTESDHVGIEGDFSLDGGSTFASATLDGGDGTTSVDSSPGGTVHAIAWDAQGDAPGLVTSSARVRLRAVDTEAGSFAESGNFAIDTRAPSIDLLTIDEIPASMNGSTPFLNTSNALQSFRLLAPEHGFFVWVSSSAGGAALDTGSLSVTAAAALGGGSAAGGADAGANIGDLFTVDAGSGTAWLLVGSDLRFPAGVHTVTARIADALGNISDPVSYTFETAPASAAALPFDACNRWWLYFDRDNFTISSSTSGGGTVTITATAAPDGTADFVEDLRLLGLQSTSPPPSDDAVTSSALVLASVKAAILGRLNELYGREFDGTAGDDAAGIQFSITQPSSPYSRIAIGGDDPLPGYTIGRAEYDYRNSSNNDNADADLGVFMTNLIEFYINSSYTFRTRFNPLIPGRGTPVGHDALDSIVLGPSFDRDDPGNTSAQNDRYDDIALAIDAIARSTATILAHEIGHSVGLVANGAPPDGLFGGETLASFAGPYTNSFHLDACENDIMAASLSFSESIISGTGGPRFNELSLAYLLERILVQ